jgi:uncharacterized protein (TIGR02270 family)
MSPSPLRPPRVLWDIVEEHLAEAAFLWKQRERALDSDDYTFPEVLAGDEARLLAHLEALRLGGERVARRVLMPALEDDPDRAAVAGYVLLGSGSKEALALLWERLLETPDTRPGLLRALALGAHPLLDQALLQRLPSLPDELIPALLEVAAFRGLDASPVLGSLASGSGSEALQRAALRAARTTGRPHCETLIRRGLEDSRLVVRAAALEAGLIHGLRAAWRACLELVTAGGATPRVAMLALATGGGPGELKLLVQAAGSDGLRAESLWALGFSGRRAAAEAALAALRSGGGPLAAEAFAAITGAPVARFIQEDVPPDEEQALEEATLAGEEPLFGEARPGPRIRAATVDVDGLERWWQQERGRFGDGRYWQGQRWEERTLFQQLLTGAMRPRAVFAWELAVRTHGAWVLEPRAWCHAQHQRLRDSRGLQLNVTRTYESITS